MTRTNIPPNSQGSRAVLETKLAEHDAALDALEAAGSAAAVKSKFLLAGMNRVHMLAKATAIASLTALTPLVSGSATLPQALARFTALQALGVSHFAGVGTYLVDGEHLAADSADGVSLTAEAPTDLTSMKASIHNFGGYLVTHATAAGVHFHNDAGLGALALTTDPPTTLAQCNVDLNDIRTAMLTHFALGSV